MTLQYSDKLSGHLTGNVSVWSVPSSVPESVALANPDVGVQLFKRKNLIVKSAEVAIIGLLRNDPAYGPAFIVVGDGGDLEQDSRVDSGGRVGAHIDDTAVRSVVARVPIVMDVPDGDCWTVTAIARPQEALSPMINEFGVETQNGTLISHYVTDADEGGRCTRYCKTSLEYLVIQWEYCFSLAFIATTQSATTSSSTITEGVFLVTTDSSATASTSAAAIARAVSGSTDIALLSQQYTGAGATLDVQADITVLSNDQLGGIAVIHLVEL